MRILEVAATSERELKRGRSTPKRGKATAILTAAAVLLHFRDNKLSAFHHLLSLFLYHEGGTKQTFRQLSKLGICMSHTTVLRKIEEVRSSFDQKLTSWKHQVETFIAQKSSASEQGPPIDYQIVGDNIDFEIRPHFSTTVREKRLIHWFNVMAVKHRILANHLPDNGPQRPIKEFEPCHCIPSAKDHAVLRQNFIVLVERVLSERIAAFRPTKQSVVQHIPHKYSDIARKTTDQVNSVKFTQLTSTTNESF